MRTFSANVEAALERGTLEPFYLVAIHFAGGVQRMTSLPHNYSYDGDQYISDGKLLSFAPLKNNNVVDRSAFKITLSDIDGSIQTEFENGAIGKDIQVWVSFTDENGVPLQNYEDVVPVYSGTIDKPFIRNDFDTITATIEGSSPLSDLDAVNSYMVSRDGMDQISSTDTSFDAVFEATEIEIRWGRE